MELKEGCFEETTAEKMVFKEKKSKLTVVNKNREHFKRVKVDDCQITEGIRCDYLLVNERIECYIELKGTGVAHAFDQIVATINKLNSKHNGVPKLCFIVCTRVAPRITTNIQTMKDKLRNHYNAKLIVQSSPLEYRIE